MKNGIFLRILLILIMGLIVNSCTPKNAEKTILDTNKEIVSENQKILTIEEQVNNGILKLSGNEFNPVFLKDVWACNLPSKSSIAISEGFNIIRQSKASSEKDDETYSERYGFSQEVELSNYETSILYWENDDESKIWSFTSINKDIEINGIKPIGKDLITIIGIFSQPSAINGNIFEYDNNDFSIKLYFEDSICIKVEFKNYI